MRSASKLTENPDSSRANRSIAARGWNAPAPAASRRTSSSRRTLQFAESGFRSFERAFLRNANASLVCARAARPPGLRVTQRRLPFFDSAAVSGTHDRARFVATGVANRRPRRRNGNVGGRLPGLTNRERQFTARYLIRNEPIPRANSRHSRTRDHASSWPSMREIGIHVPFPPPGIALKASRNSQGLLKAGLVELRARKSIADFYLDTMHIVNFLVALSLVIRPL